VNRRAFIAQAGSATAAALLAGEGLARAAPKGPTVAVVRDKTGKAIQDHQVDAAIVQRLVDRAVMIVTGKDDVAKAWASCVGPKDKVAIKINGLFPRASTHPEVVCAVVNGLQKAGVELRNITVYDRNDFYNTIPRFPAWDEGSGPRLDFRISSFEGKVNAGPLGTQLGKAATEADALINLSIMKTHWLTGVTGALKNHLGTIPNPRDFHKDGGRHIADVNALEPIRANTRICICDALYGLYHGGPPYSPRFRWDLQSILASADPVALDATVAEIVKAKRLQEGLSPYHAAIVHIERAAELGLGVADPKAINRVEAETG